MIWTWKSLGPAIGLCVLAVAYAVYAETIAPPPTSDVPTAFYPQHETELLKLEREAIANAYKQQVQSLYLNWMKDPKDQPSRAHRGANQAKDAYVKAMDAIDRREDIGRKIITKPPAEYK